MILALTVSSFFAAPFIANASTDDDYRSQASQALASSNGGVAASIIRERGYQDNPEILGEIILNGGVIAAKGDIEGLLDRARCFADATAYAYTNAGISLPVAELAFASGARTAVGQGLTFNETVVGSTTIVRVHAAYSLMPSAIIPQ